MEKTILQKILSFFSLPTYTISPESFVAQFQGIDKVSLKPISISNPTSHFTRIKYLANQIKKIEAVDKNSHRVLLDNSPALEVRITRTNGKRTIFFFDTMYIENGHVYGIKSRLMNLYGNLPVAEIAKVEIQNGRKRFRYDK